MAYNCMDDQLLNPAPKLEATHIRMARVGVSLSIRELAALAEVDKATIVRIEAGKPVRQTTLESVRAVLEEKGALFWKYKPLNQVMISIREL